MLDHIGPKTTAVDVPRHLDTTQRHLGFLSDMGSRDLRGRRAVPARFRLAGPDQPDVAGRGQDHSTEDWGHAARLCRFAAARHVFARLHHSWNHARDGQQAGVDAGGDRGCGTHTEDRPPRDVIQFPAHQQRNKAPTETLTHLNAWTSNTTSRRVNSTDAAAPSA